MKTTDSVSVFKEPVDLNDENAIRAAIQTLEHALRVLEPMRVAGRKHILSFAKSVGKDKGNYTNSAYSMIHLAVFYRWCFIQGYSGLDQAEAWNRADRAFHESRKDDYTNPDVNLGFLPSELNPVYLKEVIDQSSSRKAREFTWDYLASIGITPPQ